MTAAIVTPPSQRKAETNAAYRLKNKDRIKAQQAAKYQQNAERIKAARRERYAANKEAVLEQQRIYRSANASEIAQRSADRWAAVKDTENAKRRARHAECPLAKRNSDRAYYEKNKDIVKAKTSAYAKVNSTAVSERQAAYYEAHREERLAKQKAWSKANPDVRRAQSHKRRARALAASGEHTAADVRDIGRLQKWKCAICRCSLKGGKHVDHIVPLTKGGSNDRTNLQLLCPTCNVRKHAKDPIDYMQSRGFLL